MTHTTGKYLIVIGVIIIFTGLVIYFFHDKFHWIGRLPGDIKIDKGNFKIYFPVTTMILLSIGITSMIHLIKKIL